MICLQCCGYDDFFNAKLAGRELKRYRRRGPLGSTRRLIDALRARGVQGATLLDIGGGIGAIQHELVEAGVAEALDVDGSAAYLDAARDEAQRRGHAERVRFRLADFVEVADEIEAADIVTLDRVICCYPEMPALVTRSAARARRLYGLVYPRPTWPMRVAVPVMNLWSRLRRCAMRVYLHDLAEVDRLVCAAGLVLELRDHTWLWEIVLYRRVT